MNQEEEGTPQSPVPQEDHEENGEGSTSSQHRP